MLARYRGGMSREIRFEVDDETYEKLAALAESSHVTADQLAQQLLTADLDHARFIEGAREFIDRHAAGFADRFGTGHQHDADAA